MNFVDLTMPLNHRWMPDEGLPSAIKFFFGPKDHQEKGMVVGSDSGTSLALPSLFAEFRKTTRWTRYPSRNCSCGRLWWFTSTKGMEKKSASRTSRRRLRTPVQPMGMHF